MMRALLAVILFVLWGCSEEHVKVDYSKLRFEGRKPMRVSVDSAKVQGNGFVREVDLR